MTRRLPAVVLLVTGLSIGAVAARAETGPGGAAAERCVPGTCFAVTAALDRAPAVGETATLTVTVSSREKAADVRVVTDLPGNLRWVRPPDGTSRGPATIGRSRLDRASRTGPMRRNERVTYVGTVTATEPGPAAVNVHVSDGRPGPGNEALAYVTVGEERSFFGMARPATATPPPTTEDAAVDAAVDAAEADTCVQGRVSHVTAEGPFQGVPRLRLQAFDRDAEGGDDLLARGETDDQGDYELCFDGSDGDESGGQDVYVKGLSFSDYWSVEDPRTRGLYTFQTPVVADVEQGGREIVNYLSPPGSTDEGAFRIFTAAHATWKAYTGWAGNPGGCWVAGAAPCRQAVILWAPDVTIADAHYTLPDDTIHLSATEQLEKMTVSHELGHFIMDYVYSDAYPPTPSCNSHFILSASSEGCAWTEGWADWLAAQTYGDTRYCWGPLDPPVELESPTWGSPGWEGSIGPDIEGRVAGALMDLADGDPRNEIYWDLSSEGPEKIVSVVRASKPNTVGEFKNALLPAVPTAGGKSNVLAALFQNTVDDVFYEPLLDRVELNRPSFWGGDFSFTTTRPTWSVVAALHVGDPANDTSLSLYKAVGATGGDVISSWMPRSDQPDFIAVDATSGPRTHLPRVSTLSAGDSYLVEFAESEGSLAPGSSTELSMESADVVEIRTADLTAGVPVTFTVTPLDGQDLDVFVMAPSATRWARPRADAKGAFTKGPSAAERLTVTPGVTGAHAVIVIQKSGSGRFRLARS
ncbi:hypothetical protein DI270_017585 [Microbispora triticiradicis]|uniref:Uncharacterized protein n=1 Tax=Microbispora triticiradicis TaxID=2200763 RepID=A0ABX9LIH6_9ACTN|nr:hypothetical protein [Microbispora triticiradicis]RGA03694.1 hypothetical protein DI270_017585 [Microbispora triticiradicis]